MKAIYVHPSRPEQQLPSHYQFKLYFPNWDDHFLSGLFPLYLRGGGGNVSPPAFPYIKKASPQHSKDHNHPHSEIIRLFHHWISRSITNNYLLQCPEECLPEFQTAMNKALKGRRLMMLAYAAHFSSWAWKSQTVFWWIGSQAKTAEKG